MHRIKNTSNPLHPLDEKGVNGSLPRRHSRQRGAVCVNLVPVKLAAASIDINVIRPQPTGALPDEATDPEDNDDGKGKVRLEEALDVVEAASDRADGDIKLRPKWLV